ncbi:MAG: DUF5658 family protein [Myxococcota bacterium]|nr:DUF5658 family protein [Myxococcota bacterium]
MVPFLAAVALLVSLADHWTTWICLRDPVSGWRASEANPLAAWLFGQVGLAEGLLLDSAVTAVALLFLARTRSVPEPAKLVLFAAVIFGTGVVVVHNLEAAHLLGVVPFASTG